MQGQLPFCIFLTRTHESSITGDIWRHLLPDEKRRDSNQTETYLKNTKGQTARDTLPETNSKPANAPENRPFAPKGNNRILHIHFQVQAVSFRENNRKHLNNKSSLLGLENLQLFKQICSLWKVPLIFFLSQESHRYRKRHAWPSAISQLFHMHSWGHCSWWDPAAADTSRTHQRRAALISTSLPVPAQVEPQESYTPRNLT